MRLFTAIDVPQEVLFRLERLVVALRREALIKWSPLDNLHITTKFIGEWPENRLGELNAALSEIVVRPFEIELSDLGWFPHERSPRVLWAGVRGGPDLLELATKTEHRLRSLGLRHEDREFSPHLTLARIKNPVPLGSLRRKVEAMRPMAIGKFMTSQFTLFRSDPGSNASIYTRIRDFKLETVLAAAGAAQ